MLTGAPILASSSTMVLTHGLENSNSCLGFSPHKGNINSVVWNHNSNI